jgi:hypothetical protein
MHAMALDNLLTYQDRYKRAVEWDIWPNVLWLLGIPVVMAAHLLHWLSQWLARRLRERSPYARKWLVPPTQWNFDTTGNDGAAAIPPLPAPLAALGAAPTLSARSRLLARVTADRASRRWLARKAGAKVVIVLALALRKIGTILLSSLAVMLIVLIAQSYVDVGTLPIVDLAILALAAHWLGWTNKITEFLIGKPGDRAVPPPPAAQQEPSAKLHQE